MGFQVGKSAVMAGQEYVEQNVSANVRYVYLIWTFEPNSNRTVQSICQRLGIKTLLQRLERIRNSKAVYRAVPLAS